MLLFICSVLLFGGFMKKYIIFALLLFCSNQAFSYEYTPDIANNIVQEEQQIKFCPNSQTWGENCNDENSYTFIKRITFGSGGFSIYEKDKALYDTDTTLEFLINNQLIGYNMHKLKFYNLEFNDNKFQNSELNEEQIQKLFPNIKLVKISQFKNREITLEKPYFKPITFMLINDTPEHYYKYQLEKYPKQDELIHGIFDINKAGDYIYSHFESRDTLFPTLTIHVKNNLKLK